MPGKSLIVSTNKPIQRQHIRRIKTKRGIKSVIINLGNRKVGNRRSVQTKTKPKTLVRRQIRVPMKKSNSNLSSISQKKKKVVRLERNQFYATKILEMGQSHPMSVAGAITIQKKDGSTQTIMMEFRMSGAGMIDWLFEQKELGKPILIAVSEWGELDGVAEPEEEVEYKEWDEN